MILAEKAKQWPQVWNCLPLSFIRILHFFWSKYSYRNMGRSAAQKWKAKVDLEHKNAKLCKLHDFFSSSEAVPDSDESMTASTNVSRHTRWSVVLRRLRKPHWTEESSLFFSKYQTRRWSLHLCKAFRNWKLWLSEDVEWHAESSLCHVCLSVCPISTVTIKSVDLETSLFIFKYDSSWTLHSAWTNLQLIATSEALVQRDVSAVQIERLMI